MKIGRSKGVGSKSTSAEFEITYGIDLYGKAVELHCVTPFTKEKGIDEDGNSYRKSGFESVTCGAKALVYDNDRTGISASIGLDIQSPNTIGRGMPGRDPNYPSLYGCRTKVAFGRIFSGVSIVNIFICWSSMECSQSQQSAERS